MFYEKIKKIMAENNIENLFQLSKAVGIPETGTRRWESGTIPAAKTLVKICKYFNVSADYLLDLDDTPPPPMVTEQERELLEDFRQCSPERQQIIMETARSGAEEARIKEKSLNLKNIG